MTASYRDIQLIDENQLVSFLRTITSTTYGKQKKEDRVSTALDPETGMVLRPTLPGPLPHLIRSFAVQSHPIEALDVAVPKLQTLVTLLPTAVRRMVNLHTFRWSMWHRPHEEVFRSLSKLTKLETLHVQEFDPIHYKKQFKARVSPALSSRSQ